MVSSVGNYCVRCSSTSGLETVKDENGTEENHVQWVPTVKDGNDCVCADGNYTNSTISEHFADGEHEVRTPFLR